MPLITYRFDPDESVCVFQMESPTGKRREMPLLYNEIEAQILWHGRMLGQVRSLPAKKGLEQALNLLRRAKAEWPSEVSSHRTE